jgi:hypothetical protein
LRGGIYNRSQRKFFALYTHFIEFKGLWRVPAPFVDDSICTALVFCMPTGQSATRMSYSLHAFDRYSLSWRAGWYLSEVHTVAPSFPCQEVFRALKMRFLGTRGERWKGVRNGTDGIAARVVEVVLGARSASLGTPRINRHC